MKDGGEMQCLSLTSDCIWQVFEEIQATFLNMITSIYLEQM